MDGAASAVKNLDIKDFVPWIDINGLEPGTHEVSLHVKDAEGVTVGATTKLKITLMIQNIFAIWIFRNLYGSELL